MTHHYLYCLLRPVPPNLSDLLQGLQGVTGPVLQVTCGGELLIYGLHDGSEILQTRRNMLAHTRVLETLMGIATVMPMRFGMVCEGLDRVSRLILERQVDIGAQFAKLLDHVEIGLRVSFAREPVLGLVIAQDKQILGLRNQLAGRGNDAYYARIDLGRKIAEALDRRRGASQKKLLAALSPLAATYVLRAPEADVEVLRAEFLIARSEQERFALAAAGAAAECGFSPASEPLIQIIGPVPPYHFVSLSLERALEQEVA